MNDASPWHRLPPTIAEIEEAAARIKGRLRHTPLLESERLNAQLGGRVLVKAESLQLTGSFKVRGVLNRIATLNREERERGIVCFSSGNHGQAVAWAARREGCRALVLMPHDAPPVKVEAVLAWGAQVERYDRRTHDREMLVADIASQQGLIIVPPFDDRRIIAGAGTVALEAAFQATELDAEPDAILVGCGGGGLAAGSALAWRSRREGAEIWIAEPEDYDDTARSLTLGQRVRNTTDRTSVCDALLAPTPGELTFSIASELVSGAIGISDEEALYAMAVAAKQFGLVVEPGGILPLAAVLCGKFPVEGRQVVVVASGANADPGLFAKAMAAHHISDRSDVTSPSPSRLSRETIG